VEASLETALVALDLSPITPLLVRFLPYLLRIGTTRLILVHVIPILRLEHMAGYPVDRLEEELERDAMTKLNEYARELEQEGFSSVIVHKPFPADPPLGIAEAAEEHGADYIVAASHGKGWLRRLLLGSTVDELLTVSRKPVMVVKGIVRRGALGETRIEQPNDPFKGPLLAAIEDDEEADSVLDFASHIALKTNTKLELLHVIEPGEDRVKALEWIRDKARMLSAKGVEAEWKIIDGGSPGKIIVNEAEAINASLIIIGHGGREGVLRGSTADTVVRRARRHVLVTRKPP